LLEKAKEYAPVAGDWLSTAGKWLYDKAKGIPIIGPLINAGESIGDGRWLDAFGYLGEALEPLRVIGDLLIGGAKAITTTATNNISDFWSTIKDSLLRAVLDMVPDIKIGKWSLKQKVAEVLGISIATSTSTPSTTLPPTTPITIDNKPEKSEAKPDILARTKATITSKMPTDNGTQKTESSDASMPTRSVEEQGNSINLPAIKPTTEQKLTPEADTFMKGNKFDTESLDKALKSQTDFIKVQLEYQKQTAVNTKQLIEALKGLEGTGKTVNVNSINSPTTFMSSPMTSSSFRAGMAR